MLNIGPQELILILVVALLVVGPRRLPELGRSLGKGIRELRKAQDEVRKTIQVNLDDERPTYPRPRAATIDRGRRDDGPEPAASEDGRGEAAAAAASSSAAGDVSEISRTLGRSLSELRRAREEIQRSFRVDDEAPRRRPTPARRRSVAPGMAGRDAEAPGDVVADEPADGSLPE